MKIFTTWTLTYYNHMSDLDFDKNPQSEPYEFLGLEPQKQEPNYIELDEIERKVISLAKEHRNDKNNYKSIVEAFGRIQKIHPQKSSGGQWRILLNINAEASSVEVFTEVTVLVTDFLDQPVKDVIISTDDGTQLGRTGNDGTVSVEVSKAGDVTLVASKGAGGNKTFESDKVSISVRKKEVQLMIQGLPDSCLIDTEIDFEVVTTEGSPISNAEIVTDVGIAFFTDDEGKVTVRFTENKKIALRAQNQDTELVRYVPDEATLRVN